MKRLHFSPSRLAAAAIIIGATAVADVWVARYKILTLEGRSYLYGIPPRVSQATMARIYPHFFATPAWVVPTAIGIALLGLVAAAWVLRVRFAVATHRWVFR